MAMDDGEASATDSSSSETDRPPSLEEGEIWVEYHPLSGKTPEILRPGQSDHSPVALPSNAPDPRTPPWYPFRTRWDFEQAELFIRFGCTDSYMDNQLKLIKSGATSGHQITLSSSRVVHETLARIPVINQLPRVSAFTNMLLLNNPYNYSEFNSIRPPILRCLSQRKHQISDAIQYGTRTPFPPFSTSSKMT